VKMNREQWLTVMANHIINDLLVPEQIIVAPDSQLVRVSVGFPKGTRKKQVIYAVKRRQTADSINQLYVHPSYGAEDSALILAELAQAIVWSASDVTTAEEAASHPVVRDRMKRLNRMQESVAESFEEYLAEYGPIPHAPTVKDAPKQSTRMHKIECLACGAVWRMSAKWSLHAFSCPCCGGEQIQKS